MEIVKQRANAIKLLARILDQAKITGGSKHNAIPKEAEAVVLTEDLEGTVRIVGVEDSGLTVFS